MKPINPHGSRGARVISHFETPFEHTEEGLAAAAMRVPADADLTTKLDKAADSVIAEITGANVPEGTGQPNTSATHDEPSGP